MFRRDFLKSSTAMAVVLTAGCTQLEQPETAILPDKSIDMHAHIFNATDIPLRGFITQVILRDKDKPVGRHAYQGLVNLLVAILFNGTDTAATELGKIEDNDGVTNEVNLLQQDEARLAKGIAKFEARVSSEFGIQTKNVGATAKSDRLMLEKLYKMVQPNAVRLFGRKNLLSDPETIAAQVYRPQISFLKSAGGQNFDLIQMLRWAGIMGRDRRGVLSRLKDLYGKPDEIQVFSPSIVDFKYWLVKQKGERLSPVQDQIKVMSAIAKREKEVVLLNFVSFCPLRAAHETKHHRDPLKLVKMAIMEAGFAGVKLYPPMGFLPIGNNPTAIFGVRRGYKASGAEIEAELKRLYAWCVKHEVPIKAHGNNSLGADVGGGLNASPMHWGRVLSMKKFQDLKVNIAHFGDFDESRADGSACSADKPKTKDWEAITAELMADRAGLYVDLGYWSAAIGQNGCSYDRAIKHMKNLLLTHSDLKDRIMYGSDWSMIAQAPNHQGYHGDVKATILDLEKKTKLKLMSKIMSGNAREYLGLDHQGKQWNRLSKFFSGHTKFHEVFNKASMRP